VTPTNGELDELVIISNHLHGIILIANPGR
jgi:hypothetical protein